MSMTWDMASAASRRERVTGRRLRRRWRLVDRAATLVVAGGALTAAIALGVTGPLTSPVEPAAPAAVVAPAAGAGAVTGGAVAAGGPVAGAAQPDFGSAGGPSGGGHGPDGGGR